MQFITSLFGGSGNYLLTGLFALGIVIILIVLGVWLLKLLFNATSTAGRGRNRRLAIIDTLALDQKRQLLIIRRDNVEHLILTGGPQDVVVETGIPVDEQAASQTSRRPIPMVAARKPAPNAVPAAAASATTAAVTTAPTPVATEPSGAPGTVLAELQKQGRATNKKAHLSLRHTGLLRPVSDMELPVSPENSNGPAEPALDSATQDSAQAEIEGTDLDDGTRHNDRN
ncbi:flagellar biosynthetic protein FliO [Devosia sp. BSSL-BM10]|uniref:Flagellar biosynthetic protein FliO n=1 Tax=Devosia litorisediminis TaxID=2829817 RepID=A0A942E487_9HYPH|nr:flagellar biosynthetic protein FliO [Devosia litorisediminis]MBS3847918.1 flagellar biosynthetic protein FliO [Devosia litorisediminis]